MKKRGLAALLGICMLAGIVGCGKSEVKPVYTVEQAEKDYVEPGGGQGNTGAENGTGQEEQEPGTLRDGINQFAYNMYDELPAEENIFFSPYSLCSALSLLDVGAGSETKEELEQMLGITDLDAWNRAMKEYLEKEWAEDTFVLTANSVWMQQGKEWSEDVETAFLQPAGYYYKSELYEADFQGNPSDAASRINAWAEENTKGMIPQVVKEDSLDVVMALLNAVYFEGKWEKPFLAEDTYEDTFHGTNGDSQIEMMHQYEEYYAYVESNGIKGIALPYKDADIVMKVFIPVLPEYGKGDVEDETQDIEALFAALSAEEKGTLLDSLDTAPREEITRLALPKFTVEKSIEDLNAILQDMGMKTAFADDADFDSIGEDLFVSEVIHKAKIEVDEDGTKAAAVTAVLVGETCALTEEVPIVFEADRPFIYVIQDTQTGMILFMGRVNTL